MRNKMGNAQKIIFLLISAYLSSSAQAELSHSDAPSHLLKQNSLNNEGGEGSIADKSRGENLSETAHQKIALNDQGVDEDSSEAGHQKIALNEQVLALNDKGQPIFDLNKLHGNGSKEIASFSNLNNAPAGEYRVDFVLNGDALTSVEVDFKNINGDLVPCFTKSLLSSLNVDFSALSAENSITLEKVEQGACIPLNEIISGATVDFEIENLRLFASIPQAFLQRVPRGYVNPEFWDKGINAATLNYRLGHNQTTGDFKNQSSYAMIQAGLNVDGWNFRHFGNYSRYKIPGFSATSSYDSINTYVERALPSIGSKLTIGDSFTDGAVSESLGIRGIQLNSSDLMLPTSLRGYSPVVRGFALTNAKVEIFQNGSLIYETTVAPGAFAIDDLYQSMSNANLDVVVTEADGSKSNFIVPSSSMPQMVRDGQFRYSVAAGKFRNSGATTKTDLAKATGQYGLSNHWTAYAGLTLSKKYWATLLGSVYDTKVGAFSGDVEFSSAKMKNISGAEKFNGNRVRVGYAQVFDLTNSSIDVSAYSYDRNYLDVASKVNRDEYAPFASLMQSLRDRRRVQISYSQPLGKYGSFYVVASKIKYWDYEKFFTTAQAGYSRNFTVNNYTFGVNFNYLKSKSTGFGNFENERFALTLSFPLEKRHVSNLTATVAHDKQRGNSEQVRVNGTLDEKQRLNYGLYAGHSKGQSVSSGGNLQYRTSAATFEGSASQGSGTTQMSASVSGGVVVHSGGMTFANQLGNTVGLVYAPGAKNAVVQNSQGIKVNSNGYAVVPYLNAYERNSILLDTQNVSTDVNFASTTEQTVPYENAVVVLKYGTAIGKSVLFDIKRDNGTVPPFGSVAVLADGKEVGVVGQGGSAFVYGLGEKGEFDVKWGDEPGKKCVVNYELDSSSLDNNVYAKKSVACTAIGN